MIYAAAFVLVYLYAFWLAYLLVMGLYRAHLAGRLIGVTKWLAYPVVLVGIALDVVCQYTLATVAFLDVPVRGEYLVTARLHRYVAQGEGWRYRMAAYICANALDSFDPTGSHCD